MDPKVWLDAEGDFSFVEVLGEDSERAIFRGWVDGARRAVLAVVPAASQPTSASLKRLAHEYGLKDKLESAWAARPLEFVRQPRRTMLVLEAPQGEPLDRLVGSPMEIKIFLRLAIALSVAIARLHERGLVHKDLKPSNILVNSATGQAWLMGFGIASHLPRERQGPEPPEFLEGTLAYMAPEQTGRMNRSIDSRSDLYSLGVTFYQMLTGRLPFAASDPMEWVHCHIARMPVPPCERLGGVPGPVSAIIMKLLAKTTEERYQTAAGVESDLRRCFAAWESGGSIDYFPLGESDIPDRLLLPEKLYGRAHEIDTLLASFDRVVAGGRPELVLVSGYSGIGKSSVVNELHKVLVPPRGLFAAGKFDQYKRDIPYATLAQAFQSLVRPLLSKGEAELSIWRAAFREALDPNGLLIVDIVPELKHILGEQPPVSELPPQDAQRRFQSTLRRFIGVFARPEHPLALFLDDLQWLDAATLDLLEALLSESDMRHLMLIGAYRDNEVNSTHPLTRKIEEIRQAGAPLEEIVLMPLNREDLGDLVADSLRCSQTLVLPLAELIHEKTAGNPFFAIQFILSLEEEKMLTFDQSKARWSWDLNQIRAKGYTDNVVDLMVGKLSRLSVEIQSALRQLACLGNSADLSLMTAAFEKSEEQIHAELRESVKTGLVLHSGSAYKFLHDRVQEAAYSLIAESERAATHLRIGRLLAERTVPEEIEENIFEITNQINRGYHLIASSEERERVAGLNLIAGRRAKLSAAYASALSYLTIGRTLLADDVWNSNYELIFAIEYNMAECELLTGDLPTAEKRLSMLVQLARRGPDTAAVTRLRLTLYTTLDRSDRGVEVCLEYLRLGGGDWPSHPTREQVQQEYERIWSLVGSRQIEELINLPSMRNPDVLAAMEVLAEVVTPAMHIDENLSSLVVCRMVNLSLEHGNSDGSCFAYVWFANIAGPRFGNYKYGFRFGRLGYDLVEDCGLKRYQARTYMSFGSLVIPWARHMLEGRDLVRRAFVVADRTGDVTFACYSCNQLVTNLLAVGDPLPEIQREAERGLEYARRVRFGFVIDNLTAQLRLVQTLRGMTPKFGSFNDEEFDEDQFERHLTSNPVLGLPTFRYWVRKVQARFFAGEYASAVEIALKAENLLWTSPSHFETAELCFYGALSNAASWNLAEPENRREQVRALVAQQKQLELWASNCPANFENRTALVAAEIARIEGRDLDAMRLYEEAIRSAHANGFVHNEALACELAATFCFTRGFDRMARAYLQHARHGYIRWGAGGKVRQLESRYLYLIEETPATGATGTIGAFIDQLDLATVVRVLQSVSTETVLEKLTDTLMRTAIEHAGAERGLLILSRGDVYVLEAEATTIKDTVRVDLCERAVTAADLPESVLHYVVRTKESVFLNDALVKNPFAADEYVKRHRARSILCLPLLKQTRLVGVLYLENNLTLHVFTPARITVLKLLASEAAASFENVRLYAELQEREAKLRRLVDSNVVGVFIWDADGRIIDANEAFLRIIGYDRDDLLSGRLRWRDLTPAEWSDADNRRVAWLMETGTVPQFEKEYFHKNGSRVPVLVGAARFERGDQGVAFVVDLTERKKADEKIRETERRYREVQMELALANRVATTGQLSASIAHEINQPIGAAITYANAALSWLQAQPPDLDEARQALGFIVESGIRAAEVIDRIRALFKKAPLRKEDFEINDAIQGVVGLTRFEAAKNGVSVLTRLGRDLPPVCGDRVQVQQVILNLVVNAIEAMTEVHEEPRELLISTAKVEPEGVLVAVQDTGPGFPADALDTIFEAFHTTKPNGLGMGLSICRSIIEAHGGRLWAMRRVPQGAIFNFTLPTEARRRTP